VHASHFDPRRYRGIAAKAEEDGRNRDVRS
jgi:hypothetical protein